MHGWDVQALVTVIPKSHESWMFHFPAVKWTRLQAESIGIPQTIIRTEGLKEDELEDLRVGLKRLKVTSGIEGIVSGAVASEYQKTRLDNLCETLSLKSFAPLWHKDQRSLLREQIESGFEVVVTACHAMGLDQKWLGRKLGLKELEMLANLNKKYGLNVTFEGGEAETFVISAPMFKRRLSIIRSTPKWSGESGFLEIEEIRLD